MTTKEPQNECTDRDSRPLEWKEGEGEREGFINWWNSLPLSYRMTFQTNLHHWAGWKARQPEIDALKFDREFHEIVVKARNHLLVVNKALKAENEKMRNVLRQCQNALEPYDDIKPRNWITDKEKLRLAHQAIKAAMTAPDTKGE